jgi:uncharacterized lipoprotein YddW (UPF0748 family)
MLLNLFLCVALAFFMLPQLSSAVMAGTQRMSAPPCRQPSAQQPAKRQLRAAWVATVNNTDWPSKPGLPVAAQQKEFIHILTELQRMHMNTVVVQVRPEADAFYPSQYAPWSAYLTGVQGKNPGYNPLAFMVKEAHQHNIAFHAWFNPYRVSLQDQLSKLAANNPARQHPNWVVSYGGKLYYNPGIPAVREFLVNSILEVVKNYDIDAIHFDDYFYPYPVANTDFPDSATYHQYGKHFANVSDWRRNNVNQLIHELSTKIKALKPYVQFGISPFGVWRNKSVDASGSDTHAGASDFDSLYADTRIWIKQQWIDYIAPQIYWQIGFKPAAYDKLVPWWAHEVAGTHVQLFIGQAAYQASTWNKPDEISNQLTLNRKYGAVQGSIFFSMKSLLANPLDLQNKLITGEFKYPALLPALPGNHTPPAAVDLLPPQNSRQGVTLHWDSTANNASTAYVVYRFPGHITLSSCTLNDAQAILAIVHHANGKQQTFVDTTARSGQSVTYVVTALDHWYNESAPGHGQTLS